jgi:hypothetical protein
LVSARSRSRNCASVNPGASSASEMTCPSIQRDHPTFLDRRPELVKVGQAVAGGLTTHRHVLHGRQYPLVCLGPAGPGSAVRGIGLNRTARPESSPS